jgi:multiple antibiotic resistance protein
MLNMLLHDVIAMLTILNPIAAASLMISILPDSTKETIGPIAFKATMTVLAASLITLFGGEFIFKLFGINVMSLKVIGGVILMIIAINMAYGQGSKTRQSQEEHNEAETKDDISIVPLAIPILFGPGVIATIIVLDTSARAALGWVNGYATVTASILISSFFIFLILNRAHSINAVLGVTGRKVLTRIMGLVVGAIAAQFLVDGIKGLWGM